MGPFAALGEGSEIAIGGGRWGQCVPWALGSGCVSVINSNHQSVSHGGHHGEIGVWNRAHCVKSGLGTR